MQLRVKTSEKYFQINTYPVLKSKVIPKFLELVRCRHQGFGAVYSPPTTSASIFEQTSLKELASGCREKVCGAFDARSWQPT